ncbi:hypothetical protein H072_11361 [Dactylellina haptotyla CBS 200.50]|uniref:Uncharacterized protein n=1 Tax=Dactylellina haptotyla (strain CBS 200.50) TaxID=1284197 RepID=S7ZX36_DACHA|nr:hypothetical protein H072_11361 [Dactylellina haptotyla CBS 200.50]
MSIRTPADTLRKPLLLFGFILLMFILHRLVNLGSSPWESSLPEFDNGPVSASATITPTDTLSPQPQPTAVLLEAPEGLSISPTENSELLGESSNPMVSDEGESKGGIDTLHALQDPDAEETEPATTTTTTAAHPLRTLSHEELQKLISEAVRSALKPYEVLLKDCKKSQGL